MEEGAVGLGLGADSDGVRDEPLVEMPRRDAGVLAVQADGPPMRSGERALLYCGVHHGKRVVLVGDAEVRVARGDDGGKAGGWCAGEGVRLSDRSRSHLFAGTRCTLNSKILDCSIRATHAPPHRNRAIPPL